MSDNLARIDCWSAELAERFERSHPHPFVATGVAQNLDEQRERERILEYSERLDDHGLICGIGFTRQGGSQPGTRILAGARRFR